MSEPAANLQTRKIDEMYPEQDYHVPFPNMESEYQLAGPALPEAELRK